MLPSIQRRVSHTLLGMALLWALLVSAVVWQVVHHEVDELMDQGLRETAELLHSMVRVMPLVAEETSTPTKTKSDTHPEDQYEHLIWQVIHAPSGQVLRRSSLAPNAPLFSQPSPQARETPDGQWHTVTLPLRAAQQTFLLVAQTEGERGEARTEATVLTLVGAVLMGLLVTALMTWRIRFELRPLLRLSQAVSRVDVQQASTLPVAERAELIPMVDALRDLGKRLNQRIAHEQSFAAHAAHALRTPLAGIDAQLAIALKEAHEDQHPRLHQRIVLSRAAAKRLSHVMQALLTLFRSGRGPQRVAVRVADLLPALDLPALQRDGLNVFLEGDPTVNADPDLFAAVLFNLLDNAQRHQATTVTISVNSPHGSPSTHCLRLHDDGEGSTAKPTFGLGLALAASVAQAHGGELRLPPVTSGFCVELVWPASEQAVA